MKISIIIVIITANIKKKKKRNQGQHLIARMHANAFWERRCSTPQVSSWGYSSMPHAQLYQDLYL